MRRKPQMHLYIALALLLALAVPGAAQIEVKDLGYYQPKPLEPGSGVVMAASPDTTDGQAALGDGFIVFKFQVRDVDPIADDASDVRIDCIVIENLGTATGGSVTTSGTSGNGTVGETNEDIVQVMVMDQDSNSVASPQAPSATGSTGTGGGGTTGSCPSGVIQRTNDPGNAQIAWQVFFDANDFIIPDDGSETFQVAVRMNTTANLDDESQNHTLMLRATVVVEEVVGSPPQPSLFVERVMDSSTEVIWNGGINSWTDDSYVINPLMPGDTGVVSRFTICDWDANEHQLIINRFFVKQDENGTALSSDITSLDLYRVEGFTRTMVASRTPDGDFHRSSGAANGMPLPGFDGTSFTDPTTDPRFAVTVPDDTCYKFELEAKISPFAFKGHTIKPRIQISAEEPRGTPIDDTVQPEIITGATTVIGKGLISIPDTRLIGKPGIVPINVEGVQLPGFSTLQIGPRGMLTYNPNVIQVKSITGVHPYVVDASEIDNRRGEARFTVRLDPVAGNPFLTSVQNGTVAEIRIEPIGKPGTMSRWMLMYDCFELVAQMNCLPTGFPFKDMPNQNPNNDVSVQNGKVFLVYPGDVDLDGQPTVADAVKVATAILPCASGITDLPSPQTPSRIMNPPLNKTLKIELTDEQKSIADVAAPFAGMEDLPSCNNLTSADVAEIARLAINFDGEPAPKPTAAIGVQARPWYGFLNDFWSWLTVGLFGADEATLSVNTNTANQAFDVAIAGVPGAAGLGGIQGRAYFDPGALQVRAVAGVNGYQVLASQIDNARGEVRFIAIAPDGHGIHAGNVVRLSVTTINETNKPTLAVEFLIDEHGADIPFAVDARQVMRLNLAPLQLGAVQALAEADGGFRVQALGQGIAAIQVQLYDLAGGKLLDREAAGNTLRFLPMDRAGRPLANGVYLYVVTAKGHHGETVRSDVKKLVILR